MKSITDTINEMARPMKEINWSAIDNDCRKLQSKVDKLRDDICKRVGIEDFDWEDSEYADILDGLSGAAAGLEQAIENIESM